MCYPDAAFYASKISSERGQTRKYVSHSIKIGSVAQTLYKFKCVCMCIYEEDHYKKHRASICIVLKLECCRNHYGKDKILFVLDLPDSSLHSSV